MRATIDRLGMAVLLASSLTACVGSPRPASPAFIVEPVAERTLHELPPGPLYWRVETFPDGDAARAAASPTSLVVEDPSATWLFTLERAGRAGGGGRLVAEIGPVPIMPAAEYRLRINRAGGPPGATTPVHSHPGSEAFHVLTGQLTQRTAQGLTRLDAGESMNGHAPGTTMQLTSSGATALDQFVMFVVDASKPFSTPASFE